MKSKLVCLAVLIIALIACRGFAGMTKDSPTMRFIVAESGGAVLEGVEVLLARSGELVPLGKTGPLGTIDVQEDDLHEVGAVAILFCKDFFVCGALRLDQERFFEYDEHFLVLAPFTMR